MMELEMICATEVGQCHDHNQIMSSEDKEMLMVAVGAAHCGQRNKCVIAVEVPWHSMVLALEIQCQ